MLGYLSFKLKLFWVDYIPIIFQPSGDSSFEFQLLNHFQLIWFHSDSISNGKYLLSAKAPVHPCII